MFHRKRLGKRINALHDRALRMINGCKSSSFKEMLEKDNTALIDRKNL